MRLEYRKFASNDTATRLRNLLNQGYEGIQKAFADPEFRIEDWESVNGRWRQRKIWVQDEINNETKSLIKNMLRKISEVK